MKIYDHINTWCCIKTFFKQYLSTFLKEMDDSKTDGTKIGL